MTTNLEVLFAPAEFAALKQRDLSRTCCVVFDVLRATSSMITALANGAEAILPVAEIAEALSARTEDPSVLLAGERHGVRIESYLTRSVSFDLGNSPREFRPEVVKGKKVVMTTTNGTRALRSCAHARRVLVGSLLNLSTTADAVLAERATEVLLICSGTFEEAAYEDTLAAGAFADLIWDAYSAGGIADSALMARKLFSAVNAEWRSALAEARNGGRLLSIPALRDDVSFCAEMNRFPLLAEMDQAGLITRSLR